MLSLFQMNVWQQRRPCADGVEQLSLCELYKRSGCADCACFLQTLGHLEKAVVLELTLKHVKALTSLLEQQQQKILALQSGMQIGELQLFTLTLIYPVPVEHCGFDRQYANYSKECRMAGL